MFSNPHRLAAIWRFARALGMFRRQQRDEAVRAEIWAEAERQGIRARVRAADAAIGSADFDAGFQRELAAQVAAGAAPTNEAGLHAIACRALHAMGVDLTDVHFTAFWSGPKGCSERGLGPNQLAFGGPEQRCGMTPEAAQRCMEAIRAREAKDAA